MQRHSPSFPSSVVQPGVLAALMALPASAKSPEQGATAALEQLLRERQAPGLQYAFVDLEGVRLASHLGTADLEQGLPVTAETVFHGYSVTKTFTAAAVLALAAEGKVDLDAPVSTWLPELPDGRPTLRQVLTHTAGFPNPIPLRWTHPAGDPQFDEQAFVQRVLAEHGRLDAEPGTRFAYSNVGYLVLGEVVRRVSGWPYRQFVEERLLAPLRLEAGQRLQFEFGDPAQHARGYIARWSWLNLALGFLVERQGTVGGSWDGWTQFGHRQVDGDAYGGLLGNAAGFARALQALLRREPPYAEALVEALFTPGRLTSGEQVPVGLAWFHGTLDGEPYFDHAGGGGGSYAELRVYPRLQKASVLLLNRTGIKNDRLLDRVDRFLLAGPPGATRER